MISLFRWFVFLGIFFGQFAHSSDANRTSGSVDGQGGGVECSTPTTSPLDEVQTAPLHLETKRFDDHLISNWEVYLLSLKRDVKRAVAPEELERSEEAFVKEKLGFKGYVPFTEDARDAWVTTFWNEPQNKKRYGNCENCKVLIEDMKGLLGNAIVRLSYAGQARVLGETIQMLRSARPWRVGAAKSFLEFLKGLKGFKFDLSKALEGDLGKYQVDKESGPINTKENRKFAAEFEEKLRLKFSPVFNDGKKGRDVVHRVVSEAGSIDTTETLELLKVYGGVDTSSQETTLDLAVAEYLKGPNPSKLKQVGSLLKGQKITEDFIKNLLEKGDPQLIKLVAMQLAESKLSGWKNKFERLSNRGLQLAIADRIKSEKRDPRALNTINYFLKSGAELSPEAIKEVVKSKDFELIVSLAMVFAESKPKDWSKWHALCDPSLQSAVGERVASLGASKDKHEDVAFATVRYCVRGGAELAPATVSKIVKSGDQQLIVAMGTELTTAKPKDWSKKWRAIGDPGLQLAVEEVAQGKSQDKDAAVAAIRSLVRMGVEVSPAIIKTVAESKDAQLMTAVTEQLAESRPKDWKKKSNAIGSQGLQTAIEEVVREGESKDRVSKLTTIQNLVAAGTEVSPATIEKVTASKDVQLVLGVANGLAKAMPKDGNKRWDSIVGRALQEIIEQVTQGKSKDREADIKAIQSLMAAGGGISPAMLEAVRKSNDVPLIAGIAFGLKGHSGKNAERILKALVGPYTYGRNILHLVLESDLSLDDKMEMTRIFMKQGADLLARDQRQITPLALAKGSPKVMEPLLDKWSEDIDRMKEKVQINSRVNGRPLLHSAIEGYKAAQASNLAGRKDIFLNQIKDLLHRGAKPNFADASGYTAMHLAAESGSLYLFDLLRQHGGDPNVKRGLFGVKASALVKPEKQAEPFEMADVPKVPLPGSSDSKPGEMLPYLKKLEALFEVLKSSNDPNKDEKIQKLLNKSLLSLTQRGFSKIPLIYHTQALAAIGGDERLLLQRIVRNLPPKARVEVEVGALDLAFGDYASAGDRYKTLELLKTYGGVDRSSQDTLNVVIAEYMKNPSPFRLRQIEYLLEKLEMTDAFIDNIINKDKPQLIRLVAEHLIKSKPRDWKKKLEALRGRGLQLAIADRTQSQVRDPEMLNTIEFFLKLGAEVNSDIVRSVVKSGDFELITFVSSYLAETKPKDWSNKWRAICDPSVVSAIRVRLESKGNGEDGALSTVKHCVSGGAELAPSMVARVVRSGDSRLISAIGSGAATAKTKDKKSLHAGDLALQLSIEQVKQTKDEDGRQANLVSIRSLVRKGAEVSPGIVETVVASKDVQLMTAVADQLKESQPKDWNKKLHAIVDSALRDTVEQVTQGKSKDRKSDIEAIQSLVRVGAELSPAILEAVKKSNDVPLIAGIVFGLEGRSDKNAERILKTLAGPYSYGRNILHLVFDKLDILDPAALSLNDKLKMTEIFLKQGADLLARDQRQITPLALAKNTPEALDLVLNKWSEHIDQMKEKVAINSRVNGRPLLHSAIEGYTAALASNLVARRNAFGTQIKALLKLGAKPNFADANGYTAMHLAAESGSPSLVSLLEEHGGNPNGRRGLFGVKASALVKPEKQEEPFKMDEVPQVPLSGWSSDSRPKISMLTYLRKLEALFKSLKSSENPEKRQQIQKLVSKTLLSLPHTGYGQLPLIFDANAMEDMGGDEKLLLTRMVGDLPPEVKAELQFQALNLAFGNGEGEFGHAGVEKMAEHFGLGFPSLLAPRNLSPKQNRELVERKKELGALLNQKQGSGDSLYMRFFEKGSPLAIRKFMAATRTFNQTGHYMMQGGEFEMPQLFPNPSETKKALALAMEKSKKSGEHERKAWKEIIDELQQQAEKK